MDTNLTLRCYGPSIATRERLLRTALELFAVKGYAATSVREIVVGAGVTKTILYYYFTNKEAIYSVAVEEQYRSLSDRIEYIVNSCGTAKKRITDVILTLADEYSHLLIIMIRQQEGSRSYSSLLFSRISSAINKLTMEGIGRREFCQQNVENVSWIIVACLNNTINEQAICTNHKPLKERLLAVLDFLLISGAG